MIDEPLIDEELPGKMSRCGLTPPDKRTIPLSATRDAIMT
jgi:hypothetical protein